MVDELLEEYAQRYHALKTPRKLQWKKNLGIVKVCSIHMKLLELHILWISIFLNQDGWFDVQLELQFEDRSAQFMVSPMHASIIMLFENCSRLVHPNSNSLSLFYHGYWNARL